MDNVVSFFLPQSEHTKQIETGFRFLQRNKFLKLELRYIPFDDSRYPTIHMVIAKIQGVRMAFDVLDGYNIDVPKLELFLQNVDVYFKRSCSTRLNYKIKGGEKIKPLGLNYYVEYPSLKNILKKIILNFLYFWGYNYGFKLFPHDISFRPILKQNKLKILFITRLWNLDETVDIQSKMKWNDLNCNRIELCKKLRKKYPYCMCGLIDSPLARLKAPDLILSDQYTNKRAYLKIMHESDICIATTGLHDSIGWRFGEYVASSKIILTEKLRYEVPYEFSESRNYFEFHSIEECFEIIEKLQSNPTLANQIKLNNETYYLNYLKPDLLIYNRIKEVIDDKLKKSNI